MGIRAELRKKEAAPLWLVMLAFFLSVCFVVLIGVSLWALDTVHHEFTPMYDEPSFYWTVAEMASISGLIASIILAALTFIVGLALLWDWLTGGGG